ncbi:MAG: hypothetical protein LBD03_05465 [Methanobrevibacter sp.]|jgi:hypothetical protein|nr:hypothetical protein [Candidatus Methanovirga procula]
MNKLLEKTLTKIIIILLIASSLNTTYAYDNTDKDIIEKTKITDDGYFTDYGNNPCKEFKVDQNYAGIDADSFKKMADNKIYYDPIISNSTNDETYAHKSKLRFDGEWLSHSYSIGQDDNSVTLYLGHIQCKKYRRGVDYRDKILIVVLDLFSYVTLSDMGELKVYYLGIPVHRQSIPFFQDMDYQPGSPAKLYGIDFDHRLCQSDIWLNIFLNTKFDSNYVGDKFTSVSCAPKKGKLIAHSQVLTNPILLGAVVNPPKFPECNENGNVKFEISDARSISTSNTITTEWALSEKASVEVSAGGVTGSAGFEHSEAVGDIKGVTMGRTDSEGTGISLSNSRNTRWLALISYTMIDYNFISLEPTDGSDDFVPIIAKSTTGPITRAIDEKDYLDLREKNHNTNYLPDLNIEGPKWGNINTSDPSTYNKPSTSHTQAMASSNGFGIKKVGYSWSDGEVDGNSDAETAKVSMGVGVKESVSFFGLGETGVSAKFEASIGETVKKQTQKTITYTKSQNIEAQIAGTDDFNKHNFLWYINKEPFKLKSGQDVLIGDIGVDHVYVDNNQSKTNNVRVPMCGI